MSTKRKRATTIHQSTPSKRRQTLGSDGIASDLDEDRVGETPSKTRVITKSNDVESESSKINGFHTPTKGGAEETPKSRRRKTNLTTPSKVRFEDIEDMNTPNSSQHADRSARKKATARIIEKSLRSPMSDDEVSDEDDELTGEILDERDEMGEDDDEEGEAEKRVLNEQEIEPSTPKRGRGRPKGSKNKREDTPPLENLPPHEQFFWQNRPGAGQTSNNTLPSHLLLNHDEYFSHRQTYKDPHQKQRDFLLELHKSAFPQWLSESRSGFNICLYGYGSKRQIIQALAQHIHEESESPSQIVVVNGYNTALTLKDILSTVALTLFPKNARLPLQPAALQALIIEILSEKPPAQPIYLLINSLDSSMLRRSAIQSTLATLAAHPSICIIASLDTPNFPLLWDLSLRRQFRWVYHDATTYAPFDGAELDVVESVNELLGRSGRRIGGRDGVGFVLKSLPENARNLYRILVAEQLAASIDADNDLALADDEQDLGQVKDDLEPKGDAGIEYRLLYHKAREELVCSTEHQFRTLLKEFYDHQMIESRRDGLGAERLIVPWRKDELEGLLEELVE